MIVIPSQWQGRFVDWLHGKYEDMQLILMSEQLCILIINGEWFLCHCSIRANQLILTPKVTNSRLTYWLSHSLHLQENHLIFSQYLATAGIELIGLRLHPVSLMDHHSLVKKLSELEPNA